MKSTLDIILIVATLAMAIGGAFTMLHVSGDHVRCPLAALAGNTCANIVDPFAFAISHMTALLGFFTGVIVRPVVSLALGFSALVAFSFLSVSGPPQLPLFARARSADGDRRNAAKQKWLRWFSVLEKRDPSLFYAVNA